MERFDIAIIGSGPAGLEAAVTAKIRNKKILLVGNKNLSSKISKAHTINNFLGLPAISGEELCKKFLNHLESLEIEITEDRINCVYAMGNYFMLQGHSDNYEASSVILACGTSVLNPIEGELENLGRGVSYCATCDAMFYKNKTAVVVGYSADEEKEAKFISQIADKVFYLPMYKNCSLNEEKISVIAFQKIYSINRTEKMNLILENETIEADGIFILREHLLPSQLVPGLRIEENRVAVDRKMQTSIKGLFACGDITGEPYQYIKAAGEGNISALSAVEFLDEN